MRTQPDGELGFFEFAGGKRKHGDLRLRRGEAMAIQGQERPTERNAAR